MARGSCYDAKILGEACDQHRWAPPSFLPSLKRYSWLLAVLKIKSASPLARWSYAPSRQLKSETGGHSSLNTWRRILGSLRAFGSIDAYFCSTIVCISQFLDGTSLVLDELDLTSRQTNDTTPIQIPSLRCPNINALYVDAESFINLLNANVEWPSTLREVYITRYRPEHPLPAASPARLVTALEKLDGLEEIWTYTLSAQDIQFDPSDLPSEIPSLQSIGFLRVSELDGPFIPVIFNATRSCT